MSGAYFDAMRDADEALDDALRAIRDEQSEGRLSPLEAASERVTLLQHHINELRRLRAEHLGVAIPPIDGGS